MYCIPVFIILPNICENIPKSNAGEQKPRYFAIVIVPKYPQKKRKSTVIKINANVSFNFVIVIVKWLCLQS